MYGFTVNRGFLYNKKAERVITYKNVYCINNMIHKFEGDKIFYDDADCIIILDGVILNKKSLCKNNSWELSVKDLYYSEGRTFFKLFRGSFAGAFYDKKSDRWTIFTDQLGQKFFYYYFDGKRFCCSSMMVEIYDILRENNIEYSFDNKAAYMLLTYGFMLEDYTLCREIRKIRPGSYITIEQETIEEHSYYYLNNKQDKLLSEQEIINKTDELFRKAVQRQFDKDIEYGYKHLCALSGGLDARMTTFVADELGFNNQLNFTFSQSDYYDDFLPKHMARDLKHEWLFKSLDNGLWLYDVDRITQVTGGNVLYYGLAHGDSLFRLFNFEEYGLVHSGQLGDVILSTKVVKNDERYEIGDGAYSTKYLQLLNDVVLPQYPNKEIGCFYTRYLNGTNNGIQNIFNYSETYSPFLDLEFIEFCLSIPNNLRYNHRIYKKWIIQKYPQAAEYVWETTHSKITTPVISVGHKSATITDVPRMIYHKLRNIIGIEDIKTGMNPIGKYLQENNKLCNYLNNYFAYVDCIQNVELRKVIEAIKNNGTSVEKVQAVSLLSALKMFFS